MEFTETVEEYRKAKKNAVSWCSKVSLERFLIECLKTKTKVRWNPVNPVNNGPQKSGRVNGVSVLRMVLTKYKDFCARLRQRRKSRPLQRLLGSTKKNGGSHAFFRNN